MKSVILQTMKKNNLLLISFLIFLSALCNMTAQTIRGKVVNDADLTLADVRIYLDGTQTGTVSAADGSFTLDLTGKSPANLVFRKEDYETLITPAPGALNKTLKVVLLKSNDIEEVRLVPYTEEAYRNYITYFLDQFIGTDHEHVRIKNQRTLKFAYDKTNKTLTVKAPQTLLIENKNLGYEIAYTIVDFFADFNTRMVRNTGTSFFRKTKDTDRIKLNRRNAYDGSLLHFFRSIYYNTVASEGFIVNHVIKVPNPRYPTGQELEQLKAFAEIASKNGNFNLPADILDISERKRTQQPFARAIVKTRIPDTDYVKRTGSEVLFSFKDILQVNYPKYEYELKGRAFMKSSTAIVITSFLHPEGETFEVSKDGNISTPDLLITEGDFTKNKIENMLPLDYQLGD